MNSSSKSLECPFTWQIDEGLVRSFDETDELAVDVDEEPILAFVKSIMLTFILAKNRDYNAAKVKNVETHEIWNKMDLEQIKKEGISTRVLQHVKQATEYHLHLLAGDTWAAALVMDALEDPRTLNSPTDWSTLEGCKSIAWLSFYEARHETGLKHAELAASGSPECPSWHYLRCKGYQYARMLSKLSKKPSEKERQAILRCRELSARPFYAFHLSMMLRKGGDYQISQQLYIDIYEECMRKPEVTCANIALRLALIFIRNKDLLRAEKCLDRAQKICPKHLRFLHYKGKYLMLVKDFKQAAVYLEEAAKKTNYGADLDLGVCKNKLDKHFDYIQHFKMMLTKHKLSIKCKQQILLHIGMHYYEEKDYINAAKYLLEAIELNIDHDQLMEFKNTTVNWKKWNIFNFVCEELLPRLRLGYIGSTVSGDVLNLEINLTNYCEPRKA